MKFKERSLGRRSIAPILCALVVAGAACSSGPYVYVDPRVERFDRDLASGRSAFDRGELEIAATCYERALRGGRAMDDTAQIAAAANNFGALRLMQRRAAEARALLTEAVAATAALGNDTSAAEFLLATAARLDGDPNEASAIVARLLARDSLSESLVTQCRLLTGHLAADRLDLASARSFLALAERTSLDPTPPMVEARAAELEGRIEEHENDPAAAARAYDRETALLRTAGGAVDLPSSLSRAGRAHLQAGDAARAADRFWRAARSAWAQGDAESAVLAAEAARSSATTAGDSNVLRLVEALLREIAEQTAKTPAALP